MAWMWTGFAMVIISAALKGIGAELLEAARVDGANEWQVFRGSSSRCCADARRRLDHDDHHVAEDLRHRLHVMTSGNYDTDVIANLMYQGDVQLRRLRPGQRARRRPAARDHPGHGSSTSASSAPRRQSDDRAAASRDVAVGEPRADCRRSRRRRSASMSTGHPLMIIWLAPDARPARELVPDRSATLPRPAGGRRSPDVPASENYADVLDQSGIGDAFVNSLFIAIPATIIPIFVAAFAAYAFSWMDFPGREHALRGRRRAARRPAADDADPDPAAVRRLGHHRRSSSRSGSPTRATACRSRSTCCATSWARCPERCSSRPTSTARAPSRRSSGSPCR